MCVCIYASRNNLQEFFLLSVVSIINFFYKYKSYISQEVSDFK